MHASNLVIGGGLAVGLAIAGRLLEASGGFTLLLLGAAVITLLSLVMILASRPNYPAELEPV